MKRKKNNIANYRIYEKQRDKSRAVFVLLSETYSAVPLL